MKPSNRRSLLLRSAGVPALLAAVSLCLADPVYAGPAFPDPCKLITVAENFAYRIPETFGDEQAAPWRRCSKSWGR